MLNVHTRCCGTIWERYIRNRKQAAGLSLGNLSSFSLLMKWTDLLTAWMKLFLFARHRKQCTKYRTLTKKEKKKKPIKLVKKANKNEHRHRWCTYIIYADYIRIVTRVSIMCIFICFSNNDSINWNELKNCGWTTINRHLFKYVLP